MDFATLIILMFVGTPVLFVLWMLAQGIIDRLTGQHKRDVKQAERNRLRVMELQKELGWFGTPKAKYDPALAVLYDDRCTDIPAMERLLRQRSQEQRELQLAKDRFESQQLARSLRSEVISESRMRFNNLLRNPDYTAEVWGMAHSGKIGARVNTINAWTTEIEPEPPAWDLPKVEPFWVAGKPVNYLVPLSRQARFANLANGKVTREELLILLEDPDPTIASLARDFIVKPNPSS